MDSSKPQTAEAWFKTGVDFQYLQFNEKQALRCFTEAINLNPGYYQAYAERGNTHRVLKNTQDALADLQRSLEIRESPSTYYIKGRILYKSGQKEEARKIMELADSLGPEDFLSYVHRAEALIDFGSREEALVCCDQALKLEPMMSNVYYLKATVLVLLDPKDALECIEQAIKLTPTVAIYYRFKACCLNALGSHQEALICCEEAMKLNINDSENYGCKAQVLVAMGKMQEALQCYDQGIRVNPTDHLNHMDKSLLLLQCGDVHGAVACYKQAIQVDPKNAVVYYNSIGCIFADFLDPRQSIEYFDQAIGLNPNEASSFINKGSSLFIMTLYEQAAECFTQAIQLNPTIVDAHTFKGASLIFMKKHREGIACFDYAISLGITDAGIYNNKGKALAELGLNEEAIACYNDGIEANPNDPLLYLNKAELLHKLGRDQEAVEIYSRAYGLIEIEYQKLLQVFGSEGFGDEVPRARTGLMKKLMEFQQVITETENVVAMVDAANPTVAKLIRSFNKLKEQRGKLMSKFVESLNSSKNKKFASPKDLNEQTSQVAKIEKEVIVLKHDLIEFQRSQGGGQNINNNNNNQEAEILEKHEAAEKFQKIETKNPELYNYSKTLFWTLINLFGAYKFLGTGSVHGNIGDDSTKGRLLARGAHSLANHAGEILRAGPFEEDLLTGLDNIIDSLYAPANGHNNNNTHDKMKIINKVLENKFGPDFDVSLQVAKLAFAVTKAREHSVTPHWDTSSSRVLPTTQVFKTKITLLSETVFDLVELDTKDKFSATLGLEDAVLLVTYLSKNHATITARNIPLEVQCADIVRVGGLDQLFVIGGGKKRPAEADPESCKVCNMF